jgi:hypothetical protein
MHGDRPNPPAEWALLGPDPRAAFTALRRVADGEVLASLAAGDAGQNASGHEAALRAMLQTGTLPSPLGWVPGEVLGMGRFEDPETARFGRRGVVDARRGHAVRAVACAGVVLAACDPENHGEGWAGADDAARLAASAAALGGPVLEGVRGLLAWAALHPEAWGDDHPHFALAAVVLAAADPTVPISALEPAAEWAGDLRRAARRPRPGRWTSSNPTSPAAAELAAVFTRLKSEHPDRARLIAGLVGEALG